MFDSDTLTFKALVIRHVSMLKLRQLKVILKPILHETLEAWCGSLFPDSAVFLRYYLSKNDH